MPLFIAIGETIRVDTASRKYRRQANLVRIAPPVQLTRIDR